jgi:hypothetical protein
MFRTTKRKPPPSRKAVRLTSSAADDDDSDNNDENDSNNNNDSDGVAPRLSSTSSSILAMRKHKLKRRGPTGGRIVRSFHAANEEVDDKGNASAPNTTSTTDGNDHHVDSDGDMDMDVDADADAGRKKIKKKKKKRKRGIGFGGGFTSSINGDHSNDTDVEEGTDEEEERTINIPPSYGKEALEQLKSEQKLKSHEIPSVENEDLMMTDARQFDTPPIILPSTSIDEGPKRDLPSESYIPLGDSRQESSDDTGDGNYIRARMADDIETSDPLVHQVSRLFPSEETDGWEEEIERMAGIHKKFSSTSTMHISSSKRTIQHPKLASLDELREKLQSTVKSIQDQVEELENSTNRRKADSDHAKVECQIQEANLKSTGEAFEFYQSLRQDVTLWVGALRDVQQKVRPVLEAFQEMLVSQNVDASMNYNTFQDDCIAILQENGLLGQVVGRQPFFPTTDGVSTIDEFGRDIRSQYRRDRDVRFKNQISKLRIEAKVEEEKQDRGQSTMSVLYHHTTLLIRSMYDDQNEKERCEILQMALNSAMQDLDRHFLSTIELKRIFFDRWYATYPDDFKQSFASLSYADLGAVLLQLELCKSKWFHEMMLILPVDSTVATTNLSSCTSLEPFFLNFLVGESRSNAIDGFGDILGRTLDKSCIPTLTYILNKAPSFIFVSSQKSRTMTDFLDLLLTHLKRTSSSSSPNNHHCLDTLRILQTSISKAIVQSLDGIAIPILERRTQEDRPNQGPAMSLNPNNIEDTIQVSLNFAQSYVVEIIQEMLCNIVFYWFKFLPIENDQQKNNLNNDGESALDGIQYVLNFLNDKFLMLLSSLVDTDFAGNAFRAIWNALNHDPRKPLEEPSLMLMTMPLRAAAHVYLLASPGR